jgi:hypothetical protein
MSASMTRVGFLNPHQIPNELCHELSLSPRALMTRAGAVQRVQIEINEELSRSRGLCPRGNGSLNKPLLVLTQHVYRPVAGIAS